MTSECGAGLSGNRADGARKLAKDELLELHIVAGVIDVDETTTSIVIELHALKDFPGLYARLSQRDLCHVERVSFGVVVQLHGLNRRSGKALWMVTLSSV